MDRFIRAGIVAAILGGLLLAFGTFLQILPPHGGQFSDQVVTARFAVSSAFRFVGTLLMTWGLLAIYARQADRAGRLGLVAVVACLVDMALQTGWMFADLFLAPAFAKAAPQILDNDPSGRLAVAALAMWFANSVFVLLGAATLRAHVLPRTCGVALIAAGVCSVLPLPIDGAVYGAIVAIGLTVAGVAAWTARGPARTAAAIPGLGSPAA